MRRLNAVFILASNRRHARNGRLFQGRFKGILVDKDGDLLEKRWFNRRFPRHSGVETDHTSVSRSLHMHACRSSAP